MITFLLAKPLCVFILTIYIPLSRCDTSMVSMFCFPSFLNTTCPKLLWISISLILNEDCTVKTSFATLDILKLLKQKKGRVGLKERADYGVSSAKIL